MRAIEAALSPVEIVGFLKGQVFKYMWRCGQKDEPLQESKKAKWYLERLIMHQTPVCNMSIAQAEADRDEYLDTIIEHRDKATANEEIVYQIHFFPVEIAWAEVIGWKGRGWYFLEGVEFDTHIHYTAHGPYETRDEAIHNLEGYKKS